MIKRVLVVGGGSAGIRHAINSRKILPTAEIWLLTKRTDLNFCDEKINVIGSILEAKQFSADVAIIANSANNHMQSAVTFAKNGAHIFVEKPISVSLSDAKSLLSVCESEGRQVAVGYNLRYSPSLNYFREQILGEAIGKILGFDCEVGQYLPEWRTNIRYQDSVSAQKKYGGGALLELSHEIDYLGWIFGEWSWVSSNFSKVSQLEIDVEDYVNCIIAYKDNASGREVFGTLIQDLIRRDKTRFCYVVGSETSMRWCGIRRMVEVFDLANKEWREVFSEDNLDSDTYILELTDFFERVSQGRKSSIGEHQAVEVLRVISAIIESNRLNRKVYGDELQKSNKEIII